MILLYQFLNLKGQEQNEVVQETGIKTISKKKKCKKVKWLSGEALQIAVKSREAKSKGEKEGYKHLNVNSYLSLNSQFIGLFSKRRMLLPPGSMWRKYVTSSKSLYDFPTWGGFLLCAPTVLITLFTITYSLFYSSVDCRVLDSCVLLTPKFPPTKSNIVPVPGKYAINID